jgi:hypothetical protein
MVSQVAQVVVQVVCQVIQIVQPVMEVELQVKVIVGVARQTTPAVVVVRVL